VMAKLGYNFSAVTIQQPSSENCLECQRYPLPSPGAHTAGCFQ
jgi:hypothetical protein